MRHLLNTLFVTSEDIYLSLDGENVVANREKEVVARYPLHTLSAILSFSYPGASPALMGACAQRGIALCFCTPRGKFLARVTGEANGNVLLRRAQYRTADDSAQSCHMARAMVFGKVYNARWSIERTRRDHGLRVDGARLAEVSGQLKGLLPQLLEVSSLEHLRGLEGAAATAYFGVFDQLILGDRSLFAFQGRSRRPPLDAANALLSFAYSLLSHDCAAALESVGLDSYVGFLHRDRPGRSSLVLDLMEELRPCLADRFVLTAINNRMFKAEDFIFRESGGVFLTDEARRTFLRRWQERKKEPITHPFLGEKLPWGLVPYIQALLLARCLRGDLEEYPPFLWK
jgi:CRISPR-associated protein Cas1